MVTSLFKNSKINRVVDTYVNRDQKLDMEFLVDDQNMIISELHLGIVDGKTFGPNPGSVAGYLHQISVALSRAALAEYFINGDELPWSRLTMSLSYYYWAQRLKEKGFQPDQRSWTIDSVPAAQLLALGLYEEEPILIQPNLRILELCYRGILQFDHKSRGETFFEPGMIKLAYTLAGNEFPSWLSRIDAGPYDDALRYCDDQDSFVKAINKLCDFHNECNWLTSKMLTAEFDTPPFDLVAYEIWAFLKLHTGITIDNELLNWSGPPPSLDISMYRDEIIEAVISNWFSDEDLIS